jgi:hypothetical protein
MKIIRCLPISTTQMKPCTIEHTVVLRYFGTRKCTRTSVCMQAELSNGVHGLTVNGGDGVGIGGDEENNNLITDAYPTTPPPPAPPSNRKKDIDNSLFDQVDEVAISVSRARALGKT